MNGIKRQKVALQWVLHTLDIAILHTRQLATVCTAMKQKLSKIGILRPNL